MIYITIRSVVLPCLLLNMILLVGCQKPQLALQEPPPPGVTIQQPIEIEQADSYTCTGRTDAIESVEIRPRVNGYLTKVLFAAGVEVKKGDPLFEIDRRPYEADLKKAEADVGVQEAQLKLADAELNRIKRGLNSGAFSRDDYDKAVAQHGTAEASLRSAKANVETAKLNLEFTQVTAPISGLVSRELVTVGNLINGTTNPTLLTTIVSMDPMHVYFDIDENTARDYVRRIETGEFTSARETKIPFQFGYTDDKGYPRSGVIDFVENRLDSQTGTIRLRGKFANEKKVASPGFFVRVRIPKGPSRKVLAVPERAIGTIQKQKYVLTVDDNNMVKFRPVKLGPVADNGMQIIEEGITVKDWVIINGMMRARPESKVDPQKETRSK